MSESKISKVKLGIIDLNVNNIFSIYEACKSQGYNTKIIDKRLKDYSFDIVIMPGVGSFNTAMKFIKKNNIADLIDPFIKFDRKYKNWSLINKSIILAIFSEIEISEKKKIKILINDYFNISKSLITKKELGMINAITDKYINEKKII